MKIYGINELKESRLIFDRKPPAFGVIITFMTLLLVTAAILWAAFSPKTYVVKAGGIVVSTHKTNIMNKVTSGIEKIHAEEGAAVNKGDLLLEFNTLQSDLQIAQLQTNIDFYENKEKLLERLIIFINGFTLDKSETRINPFGSSKIEEIKLYYDAQSFIEYIKWQEDAALENDTPESYTQGDTDSFKSQFLTQHYVTLDDYQSKKNQFESQRQMYQDSLAEYKIIALQDGIVHWNAGITIGTILQAGSFLGSISDDDNNSFVFEAVIGATERSKVTIGDSAEIAISGIAQSEFGILIGKVIEIAGDSTQTEDGSVYYRVKIKPEETQLKDKKGNTIDLTIGMLAESRIKYDETTWLKWTLEQIGIKFR